MRAKICNDLYGEICKFHDIYVWDKQDAIELRELSDRISGKVVNLVPEGYGAYEVSNNEWWIPAYLYGVVD